MPNVLGLVFVEDDGVSLSWSFVIVQKNYAWTEQSDNRHYCLKRQAHSKVCMKLTCFVDNRVDSPRLLLRRYFCTRGYS